MKSFFASRAGSLLSGFVVVFIAMISALYVYHEVIDPKLNPQAHMVVTSRTPDLNNCPFGSIVALSTSDEVLAFSIINEDERSAAESIEPSTLIIGKLIGTGSTDSDEFPLVYPLIQTDAVSQLIDLNADQCNLTAQQ
jgi:hypothetical protein